MEDRDKILSLMYNDEPESDETVAGSEEKLVVSTYSRTKKVRVGAIEYEVPSVEYVARLESLLLRQGALLEKQRREIERLEQFMVGTRNFIRRQTSKIADLQEGLDNKIDSRDYL